MYCDLKTLEAVTGGAESLDSLETCLKGRPYLEEKNLHFHVVCGFLRLGRPIGPLGTSENQMGHSFLSPNIRVFL